MTVMEKHQPETRFMTKLFAVVDPVPEWQCHKYTPWDNKWASRNNKTEQEKCERLEGRKFTGGNNADYLGCNKCRCCKPL